MICAVSFIHMLGLNSAALTGEANSGAQKENLAITMCCLYPIIGIGDCGKCEISLCINVCYAPDRGKSGK